MIHFCTNLSLNSPFKWAYSPECYNYEDTQTYFEFACMLLESVYKHHPGSPFTLLGHDLTPEQELKLKELHPFLRTISTPLTATSQEEYKGRLELSRLVFIRQLLHPENISNSDILVYLDIDCLLRAPLRIEKFMLDFKFDIGVMKRNARQYDKQINIGVLFVRNTQSSREFMRTWIDSLPEPEKISPKKKNHRTYCEVQALFYKIAMESANKGRTVFWWLPSQFNDKHLQSDSTIWHGNKGNKLDRLNDFKKEIKNEPER